FNEDGNLPPGIHPATIEEIAERFGHGSPLRRIEMRELTEYVTWAKRAAARRLLLNGSFVTSKKSPNDVDLVLLPSESTISDPEFRRLGDAAWPFLQVL